MNRGNDWSKGYRGIILGRKGVYWRILGMVSREVDMSHMRGVGRKNGELGTLNRKNGAAAF